jgi:hypothetical protein
MKKILMWGVAAIFALALSACATFSERDTGTRLLIQYSTMKLIEQSDAITSEGVVAHVERVRGMLDTSEEVAVVDLRRELLERVNLDALGPADTLLLMALLDEVELSFQANTDVLSQEDRERVGTILDWVVSAARMSG